MKTRVLIVDDEELARRGVAIRLLDHPDMVVVGECADGDEAIESVSTLRPDLIFLDVQMPGMSGIEMLRSLPDRLSIPAIIFLTAYDEYALAAFEVQALDYLLKPIDDGRFAESLERARRLLVLEQQETLYTRMLGLLEMRSEDAGPGPVKRFAVRTGKHVSFVQSDNIDWVESIGDYAGLHVGTKTHLLRESLQGVESRLDRDRFLRIHRSTIVQLDRITRIDSLPNRDCLISLRDGTSLRVSRTYSAALWDVIRNRQF
jgi:two-component system LytT family response regulator